MTNDENMPSPSLGGSEMASSNEDSVNLQFEQTKRPVNGLQKRFSELTQSRKEAEAKFAQAVDLANNLAEQNKFLMEQIKLSAQPKKESNNAYDRFSADELLALQAQYMDKDSDSYSPQKAALTMQEYVRREKEGLRKEIETSYEKQNSFAQRHAQVFEESVASLGEDGAEFSRQGSPQWQMAKVEFDNLARSAQARGESPSPELQRAAVMTAYAKWIRSRNAGSNGQIEAKRQAREMLSSGTEAQIEENVSMKSLLAQGKSPREAMLKGSKVVQDMVNKIRAGL